MNMSTKSRVIRALRSRDWYGIGLVVQVVVSGFVVMALEIIGSRLLASGYGSSLFTWGSLIGVVLSGLAIGYSYGGRLADKYPTREAFSLIIFTGGLLVLLLPFVAPVTVGASRSLRLGDPYGPLMASTLVLGPPSTVLGMVSPFAVKLAARDMSHLGKVSGNLYSLSTLGSILGAFGAAFVLIPAVDQRTILYSLGLALMFVAVFWLPRLASIFTIITLVLLLTPLTGALSGALIQAGPVAYEKETPYSHLDVVDSGQQRILYLNGFPQSGMDRDDPTRLVFAYTQYFHLGPVANPDVANVLFVGGGGFSGPKSFLATYPNVHVDVVEIDPDVIDVAYRFFEVKQDPRLTVYNEDGRVYLSETTKYYDMIVLDAYAKTYVPFHLMTVEFFQLLSSRLTDRGMVVSNLIGSLVGDTSDIIRAEYRTVTAVLPNAAVFSTTNLGLGFVQNIILVFNRASIPYLSDLLASPQATSRAAALPIPSDYLSHLFSEQLLTEDVPLLTDNFAPVESLLNPVTGQPYSIEQQTGRLTPNVLGTGGIGSYAIILLALVGILWSVQTLRRRHYDDH